jgi:hypothetical protein
MTIGSSGVVNYTPTTYGSAVDVSAVFPFEVGDTGVVTYPQTLRAAFDFANSGIALDPRITYTGASARMYFDSTGTLRYAPMNLLTYSEQFDNAAWTKTRSSVTDNTTTAPNGTLTGDTLIPNTDNNTHFIQSPVIAFTSGTSYSYTCFVKAAGYSFLRLAFGATAFPSDNRGACFDLSAGAVGATQAGVTASIASAGNGWFRCSISRAATATANDVVFIESKSQDLATPQTFIGDGTSGAFIWGAMLNLGPTAFDYIPTTTAAVYLPRSNAYQDHNPATLAPLGFLIEEQRTNLCLHSNDLTNTWTLAAATIGSNVQTAPDGTLTADSVITDTTSAFHGVNQSIAVVSGTTYTFSVFAKANGYNFLRAGFSSARFGTAVAYFDLASGTVGTVAGGSATIKACNNGWYLCSFTATCTSTGTSTHSLIYASQSDNQGAYVGDGVSGIFAWGAQFEAGAFATSPILTTGAAATRLADVASITGTNFSSFWNQTEGTIVARASTSEIYGGTNRFPRMFNANDATTNNRINMAYGVLSSVTDFRPSITTGGVAQADFISITNTAANGKTYALAYKLDDSAVTFEGRTPVGDTGCTIPTTTRIELGAQVGGTFLNGHLQSITYYAKRLPNATLQSLTV